MVARGTAVTPPGRADRLRRPLREHTVLLDVFEPDAAWYEWSAERIGRCAANGRPVIDHVAIAEFSEGFSSIDALEEKLPPNLYERAPLPWEAAFLAGNAFMEYRRARGARRSPACRCSPETPCATAPASPHSN